MKMDLKHFKKLHSNEHSTTFQDRHGHEIRVAHKALDEGMRKKLADLPKFAQGGSVGLHTDYSKNSQDVERAKAQQSYTGEKIKVKQESNKEYEQRKKAFGADAPRLQLPTGMAEGGEMSLPENTVMGNAGLNEAVEPDYSQMMSPMSSEQANSEQQEQLQNVQLPQPQTPQPSPMSNQGNMDRNMANMEHGINMQAQAEAAMGQRELQAAQQQQVESAPLQQHYQAKSQEIDAERTQVYNDLKAGHVEPNHFVQSMSGFQKGMTAIGLILSGMGSGLAGQSNMAMDFLNKQIDRDIDGQKAELGRKENLLSHLNQQMGNLKDATTMAKALQSDMYAAKLLEVAAQSKDPMAKARAEQAVAQLHFERDPQIQQMKMNQAALQAMRGGYLSPATAVPLLVPKEHQGKALEEVGKYQQAENDKKLLSDTMKEAAKIQSFGNRTSNPLQSRSQMQGLEVKLLKVLKPIFNNLSESDKEQAMANLPKITDDQKTIAAKTKNLMDLVESGASYPTLDAYGVRVPKSKQSNFTPR